MCIFVEKRHRSFELQVKINHRLYIVKTQIVQSTMGVLSM
jgi:hypothetical protein